jgi:hypothetical protein
MHAYAHDWACQLRYNTRLTTGMGLTDGEGSERLWSRMRSLISTTRACSVSDSVYNSESKFKSIIDLQRARRIWFLDNRLLHIGKEIRNDLGAWHIRKISKGIDVQSALASEDLTSCGISAEVLRTEWDAQRQAQCSVRSCSSLTLISSLELISF